MSNDNNNNQFLLGEINATVKGTAEEVRLMRAEVGTLATKLGAVEQELAEVKADRRARIEEYGKHKAHIITEIAGLHRQIADHEQRWAAAQAEKDAEKANSKRTMVFGGMLVTAVSALANVLVRILMG